MANPWDNDPILEPVGPQTVTIGTRDPAKVRAEERAQDAAERSAAAAGRQAEAAERNALTAERTEAKGAKELLLKLSQDYNSDPTVKAYRTAIQQFGQALGTGVGPQADLALTYAFAKAMDPESVVRESEQGMVTNSQPWFQATVERVKKQFGYDEAGGFTPEARTALRKQISNSVAQRVKLYEARRDYIAQQAEAIGVEPTIILGEHDAKPFVPAIQAWVKDANGQQADNELDKAAAVPANSGPLGLRPENEGGPDLTPPDEGLTGTISYEGPNTYRDSYLGQGVSGVNEGIAGVLGAPVDLVTAAMNLVPKGINAAANTSIPEITDPVGGSRTFKQLMDNWAIFKPSADPSKQFVRRVGESVGAAIVPAGIAGKTGQAGAMMLGGLGGGIGAATAQQVAPNNPLAEILGELAGGGLTTGAAALSARRAAQREIESAIPTTAQLREQAGELYDRAEQTGSAADPALTTQLADDMRGLLTREGQLGPSGSITSADNNTTKAYNLVQQYAGQPMRPKEMDTVRTVISDGRKSADPSDQRLAKILLDQFDDWARPQVPGFDEAREVSSRYLQAEDLEQARELAKANESGFSASGLENALRTQYRGLDRNTIRGRDWFIPEVTGAVQNVSRGTTASNIARGLGKMAPTGALSLGTNVGVPAMLGMQATQSPLGAALGVLTGGVGLGGRAAATAMTDRAAQIAELTARNGGAIQQARVPAAFKDYAAMLAAVEQAKYLSQER